MVQGMAAAGVLGAAIKGLFDALAQHPMGAGFPGGQGGVTEGASPL